MSRTTDYRFRLYHIIAPEPLVFLLQPESRHDLEHSGIDGRVNIGMDKRMLIELIWFVVRYVGL
jgi:hypothetical protein